MASRMNARIIDTTPARTIGFIAVTLPSAAFAVALTRRRRIESGGRRSIVHEIREGFAFVFSVQWLWVTIFGWSFIAAGFIAAVTVGLPLLVTGVLNGDAR